MSSKVWVQGEQVRGLQPVQVRLLGELVEHAGDVRTRAQLKRTLFGDGSGDLDRAVSLLRSHLGAVGARVVTVRGCGYGVGIGASPPTLSNDKVTGVDSAAVMAQESGDDV